MSQPEDSILRRHYDQWIGQSDTPEDSILSRHHAQLQQHGAEMRSSPAAPTAAAVSGGQSAPASANPASANSAHSSEPAKRGFFGRLFGKLFGN